MNKPAAIITGASTGIGREMAVKLSEQYFVYLISRNIKKLKKTAQLISDKKNECKIIVSDISNQDCIELISSQIDSKKDIELIINNAGVGIFSSISSLSVNDWDIQLNTNLRGSFLVTKIFIDQLKAKKSGTIVFINSVAGLNPYKNSTAYVASKYGLRGFASSLREELREHNIKVLSIFPGAINTPLWDSMDMDSFRDDMMSSSEVADTIINAINTPNNCVSEELTIRRTLGDF
tara:strand:- start:1478 stop:2182 length:705 start_codon:yes stop_codon:yes gene_type:complete